MVWPTSAVEDPVKKRPRVAVSLLQISAQRTIDLAHRIESLSIDKIERLLARSLIRFAERLGTPEGNGSVRNRFRKQGYLRYSHQETVLYRDALAEWIAGSARSAFDLSWIQITILKFFGLAKHVRADLTNGWRNWKRRQVHRGA